VSAYCVTAILQQCAPKPFEVDVLVDTLNLCFFRGWSLRTILSPFYPVHESRKDISFLTSKRDSHPHPQVDLNQILSCKAQIIRCSNHRDPPLVKDPAFDVASKKSLCCRFPMLLPPSLSPEELPLQLHVSHAFLFLIRWNYRLIFVGNTATTS
jgi:hypothetical protein